MEFIEPIAIVGAAGIFPGAPSLDRFWDNIVGAVCSCGEIPPSRWALPRGDVYSPHGIQADKTCSKRGCVVDEFSTAGATDLIETGLSSLVSPSTAKDCAGLDELDPLYLMTAAAGVKAFSGAVTQGLDRDRVGVVIGNIALPTVKSSALSWEILGRTFAEKLGVGGEFPHVDPINRYVTGLPAGILARLLKLGGGTMTLDAACASSLYAIQLASLELLSGRADAMLSGGVSRPDCLYTQMGFSQLRALSPDGVCSPFDHKQNGLVTGEGAGIVVLKRLGDAVRQGDRIYGVIRGIGLANDIGGELLAPNSEGQLRAMTAAYRQAGWDPNDVDLVECHATGTPLGDAVELESLKQLWGESGWREGQCAIGSVKSNIGHALTAAGAAGLLKVLLAFEHRTLPPTANFKSAAPGAPLAGSPFTVLERAMPWPQRGQGVPRRAAVSAFGFGGINAHLLLEEWQPERSEEAQKKSRAVKGRSPQIAIVGMEACFGPWQNLQSLSGRIFGAQEQLPAPKKNCFGVQSAKWFGKDYPAEMLQGFGIDEFAVPLGRFRIPPNEIKEMLAQQLLMLHVAAGALEDARATRGEHVRSGVFIGIAHDLNTGNFHVRWSIPKEAQKWAEELGLELSESEAKEWTQALRDALCPALNAGRTMGALGSIVASRIAREFQFGGPSFAVSNEENSSLAAVELAVRKLEGREIDLALAGGVDLAADIRALIGAHHFRPYSGTARPFNPDANGTTLGEGAAAVILKRLEDAERDGDRVYAVIKGIGMVSGELGPLCLRTKARERLWGVPDGETYKRALAKAYRDAGCDPAAVGYLDASAGGVAAEDEVEFAVLADFFGRGHAGHCALGSAKADVGHTGAASGMASLVKASLCLFFEMLPALEVSRSPGLPLYFPHVPQYWVRNRAQGPRTAAISSISIDGNCGHLILEGHEGRKKGALSPLTAGVGIFAVSAPVPSCLAEGMGRLREWIAGASDGTIENLAARWHRQHPHPSGKKAVFVCSHKGELLRQLELAEKSGTDFPRDLRAQGIFCSRAPEGKLALVFPGVGNQYPGMGRRFALLWPEIMRQLDRESGYLREQVLPEHFWNGGAVTDHRALLLGHVTMGTMVADILKLFGVAPHAAIGYSLGETTGLFALRAWRDRDGMLDRLGRSSLFAGELTSPYHALRRYWKLPEGCEVKWSAGVVDVPAEKVATAIRGTSARRVYVLMKNTPAECVIGGESDRVAELVAALGCKFFPVQGTSVAHCEILEEVEDRYRELHLSEVTPPSGVEFYSGCRGERYRLTRESAADSIVAHAIYGVDFPKTVEAAYRDGVRIFVEVGPGASCTRMIGRILAGKPHVAESACPGDVDEAHSLMSVLGALIAENVPVDLDAIYGPKAGEKERASAQKSLIVQVGSGPFRVPQFKAPSPPKAPPPEMEPRQKIGLETRRPPGASHADTAFLSPPGKVSPALGQFEAAQTAGAEAHRAYLDFARHATEAFSEIAAWQVSLLNSAPAIPESLPALVPQMEEQVPARDRPAMDRKMCLEFAVGSIARVLGPEFAPVDRHPTRVRLPDEPLMLVDRVLSIEGQARSMTSGRVVTEHDILPGAWYLDNGRIPTCIAVEAGQADLFLSGYLGIDFKTNGLAVYRLLDAAITFHRGLPGPGHVIRYDIRIRRFFRHAGSYFFYFEFDSTVDGEPLLTMRDGCAGFFTPAELEAGAGIAHSNLERAPMAGKMAPPWENLLPVSVESYSDAQIEALRGKDLAGCFGPLFDKIGVNDPLTIPGGKMKLVDRVLHLDPKGGRFGLGIIRAEADIHPDDWFLTCHFRDDNVMPGTLMYECCMHALRVLLLRMGLVADRRAAVWEPVPGVKSTLKCRGQVVGATRKAAYEISVKELGYRPEPYAIADALMYADGRPVVEMLDMSIRLTGTCAEELQRLWQNRNTPAEGLSPSPARKAIFGRERILAFAVGKPSQAFGEPYRIFDEKRTIARLPGPPYQFLDRITEIRAEPWKMQAGGWVETQYDVPNDAWYFAANRQPHMPFAVLLEIALQPCGWLAAYLGSALTSEVDLSFRNLGGSAVQYYPVTADAGLLTTRVAITKVASSGGMIIQHYDFAIKQGDRHLYRGNTYFGFFSAQALSNQVGIAGAKIYRPSPQESAAAMTCDYPDQAHFPDRRLRMIERIETFIPDGGPCRLGYIRGSMAVDTEAWFFKAHFYQDPVIPGSLGLESGLQLLRFIAFERWKSRLVSAVAPGMRHEWIYRGQVIPADKTVTVDLWVTAVDDLHRLLVAAGFLSVDGRVIYQLQDFAVRGW